MIVAKLKVFGQEREVVNSEVIYHRMVNSKTGRAGAEPLGGLIHLSVHSGYDDDVLVRWIAHTEEDELCKLTEGELSFHEGSLDNPAIFEYKFNDAALVEYKEVFTSQGKNPMTISLVISPAIQKYKWQTLVKHWQESWVPPSDKAPYQSTEEINDPKIITYSYLDKQGKEIDKVVEGDLIMRIETKGMIGEKITIDLTDSKYDYLYKGELIANDILKDIPVNASSVDVALEVIKQKMK